MQTKQVAQALGISAKTADRHIQNAYRKIGVSSRAAATLFAMEHGLLAWAELLPARPLARRCSPQKAEIALDRLQEFDRACVNAAHIVVGSERLACGPSRVWLGRPPEARVDRSRCSRR